MYFTKTPSYSLGIIKDAVQKHDIALFKKHVDLDSLLTRGFDDLISGYLEQDKTMDAATKKMALNLVGIFKQPVVNSFNEAILRYVETGNWEVEQQKDKRQPINVNGLSNKVGFKNASFKNIAYTKYDGEIAVVGLNIFDEQLNENIILDVKMRKLADGTWQVIEWSNLKTYLAKVEQAQKK
jgi:hypothetical protein